MKLYSLMAAAGAVLLLSSCAQLKEKAQVLKPTAKLAGTQLTYIDFERADLEFELAVNNPNPVSLALAGLDYDFQIEQHSVVSGTTAKGTKIAASGVSPVSIPVSLKYEELAKLPGEILSKDKLGWTVDTQFNIKLPVIGNYPVKVSKQGELPVPKLPRIKLNKVSVEKLGLTSASLLAEIAVNNPNTFAMSLSDLDYKLDVSGKPWSSGKVAAVDKIPAKGVGVIQIPVKLDLLAMGSSVLSLLKDSKPVDYNFSGNVSVDTGHELLKKIRMPIDLKGKTGLR